MPILLVHGDADPLIPVAALHAAVQSLGAAGFLTEWHVSRGLAHGIDEDGLRLGADFLRRVLTGESLTQKFLLEGLGRDLPIPG